MAVASIYLPRPAAADHDDERASTSYAPRRDSSHRAV